VDELDVPLAGTVERDVGDAVVIGPQRERGCAGGARLPAGDDRQIRGGSPVHQTLHRQALADLQLVGILKRDDLGREAEARRDRVGPSLPHLEDRFDVLRIALARGMIERPVARACLQDIGESVLAQVLVEVVRLEPDRGRLERHAGHVGAGAAGGQEEEGRVAVVPPTNVAWPHDAVAGHQRQLAKPVTPHGVLARRERAVEQLNAHALVGGEVVRVELEEQVVRIGDAGGEGEERRRQQAREQTCRPPRRPSRWMGAHWTMTAE
jgi:hypothetical protein